ncbi:hypothetical protein EON63_09965 [archaeon]|nr:MAG: hypothetical protein EON63_09965 [archaeon]
MEELESLSSLQSALASARGVLQEFKFQQVWGIKLHITLLIMHIAVFLKCYILHTRYTLACTIPYIIRQKSSATHTIRYMPHVYTYHTYIYRRTPKRCKN